MGKLPPLGASFFPTLTGESLFIPGFQLKFAGEIIKPPINMLNENKTSLFFISISQENVMQLSCQLL